jgi:CHAP domain
MPRKITKVAVAFIDKRLVNDPLANDSLTKKRPRQLFVQAAAACLGIKEVGKNKGTEVEEFLKTVGLSPGDAWCMSFMQTCIAYVELKLKLTSPLVTSGACMQVWNNSPLSQRVQNVPLAGAIAIWQHTNDPGHGHTGMVLDCDGVSFHAVEGNTSDGTEDLHASLGQTGDGVRFTHRRFDLFNPQKGDMQLRGFLKPF